MAKNKSHENEKLVAGLSYIIIGIIWYFVYEDMKKNEFAKFHVKQAINLLLISLVMKAAIGILTFITFNVFKLISWIFGVIFLILWIVGIINVINGEKKVVPTIGQFAENYLKF